MLDEQRRNERDAPDIDVAVLSAESESFREMRADLVAVEHLDAAAASGQLGCKPLGDRTLARTGQTRKPHGESLVQLEFLSGRLNLQGHPSLKSRNF